MKISQAFSAVNWRRTAKIVLGIGVVTALATSVACTGSGSHRYTSHGSWGTKNVETMTNIELRRLDATAEQKADWPYHERRRQRLAGAARAA